MKVQESTFGYLLDGREAKLFTLTNKNSLLVRITNYGGIITHIEMPDAEGTNENIVCGFPDLEGYLDKTYLDNYPYFGAIIGRCANRIARGHLEIGGKSFPLEINNGPNHLHGGKEGFDKKLWKTEIINGEESAGVKLFYHSSHLEENYPGNLDVQCSYTLNDKNELTIDFKAESDELTVVNLTNHTYFNLTAGKETILNHELKLASDKMVELEGQIPTGKIVSSLKTPFDFSDFKTLSANIEKLPAGYDDCFVLDAENGTVKYAGTLREKKSGRKIDVFTTQPGIHVYTGYWIPQIIKHNEKKFGSYSGVALETQHYPDSVHHPHFPSVLLLPGQIYNETTIFRFTTG